MKSIVFILLLFIIFHTSAQDWGQITVFPGSSRDDGTAFAIGDSAYFGTGVTPWFAVLGNFYGLNLQTDQWFSMASLPTGKERQYASGFSDNEHGFVFGGYDGINFLNDLWRYDPSSNTWMEITPLPGMGRSGAAHFVMNDTAYIIGGKTANDIAIDEVWAYAIATDTWSQKSDLPNGNRWRASASSMNSKGYILFGRDEIDVFHNDLLEYNSFSDSWILISNFPDQGRSHASMLTVGNDLIVCFGVDSVGIYHKDLWRYSPLSNNWQSLPDLPAAGRRGGMTIVAPNGIIYYSTGLNGFGERLKETWKYHETLALPQINDTDNIKTVVKIIDILGRDIQVVPNTLLIYVYSDGTYEKVILIEP